MLFEEIEKVKLAWPKKVTRKHSKVGKTKFKQLHSLVNCTGRSEG